jgi:hypothetical protein
MALTLAACGDDDDDPDDSDPDTTPTAQTFTLTTSVDDFEGGAGNDTFNGVQSGTAADDTADAFDAVAGGAGTDTLYIINEEAAAYDPIDASGIETFKYQANDDAGDLDFDDAHGATTLELYRLNNDVDVDDLTQATTLTIEDLQDGYDGTITYNATDVDNAADAATVELKGVEEGALLTFDGDVETMTFNVTAASTLTDFILDANTTSVTIDAGADLNVVDEFNANGATTLTITGAGDVDLTGATDNDLAALATVTAGAVTGDVSLLIDDAVDQTITTGTGADVVDMGVTLDADDTIDLGAGSDTLRVDVDDLGGAGVGDLSVSNVEVLRLDAIGTGAGAIQMDNLTFDSVRFDHAETQGAADQTITLTDIATTITSFVFRGNAEASNDLFFSDTTIDYDTTSDLASVSLTFDNDGVTADDMRVGDLTIANVDQVNITASDVGQAAADEITFDDLVVDSATDVVVVSDGEVAFSGLDGTVLDTLDMSGADDGSNVTIDAAANALEVTMGDGADTVDVADDNTAATIDLGTGNDTFISGNAADTITTGAGIDTIRLTGAATDDDNVITDFTAGAGGDVIDLATPGVNLAAGTTTDFSLITGDGTADEGIAVIDQNAAGVDATAASLSEADAATYLNDFDGDGASDNDLILGDAGDDLFVVLTDGTDTGMYLITGGGAGTDVDALDAEDLDLIATLQGVSDAGSLTAANFADFV